jgi:hypothetical protein
VLHPSFLEDEHQISEKQKQVHGAQQDVGSLKHKGHHAHHQRQQQQDRISGIEAEDDGLVGDEPDDEDSWNRQADAGKSGSQREIDGALKLVR